MVPMEWLLGSLTQKDLVTIFISVLALTVSSATLYINVLRRPRLRILLGNNFGMVYERPKEREGSDENHNSKLPVALYLYVVVFNDGAKHAALLEVVGTVSNLTTGESVPFEWQLFVEAKDISGTHSHFSTKRDFAGWAIPLAVPSGGSITKQIRCRIEPSRFTEGEYTLEVKGNVFPRRRWIFGASLIGQTRPFSLGKKQVDSLNARNHFDGMDAITDLKFAEL